MSGEGCFEPSGSSSEEESIVKQKNESEKSKENFI
jgi:hypothetical protein